MNKQEVIAQLKEIKTFPKKSLGQNFLINSFVLDKILFTVKELSPKNLIEVGPGLGALTWPLSQLNAPLTLIELDRSFCRFWREKGFTVIEGDVLRLKDSSKCFDLNSVLVGSLPYQVSSRLVVDVSLKWKKVSAMVFMIQKEVAERVLSSAGNKNFSLLSVIAQTFWNVKLVAEAKTSDFYPRPRVEGTALLFKRKPFLDSAQSFFQFVKICFQQRRKILKNRLIKAYGDRVLEVFDEMDLPQNLRVEQIPPPTLVQLHQKLKNT